MKIAILSVGTELLIGKTPNTNTTFLSSQLNLIGHDVMYHHTVGDNPDRMRQMMELSLTDCDMIITTGGLGPTRDDITKEIACQVMGDELVLHQPSMEALEAAFRRMNRPMTENNIRQAMMPTKATVFENDQGTAPGMALEIEGKTIICLPGPPREMKAMFEKKVKPYLEERSDGILVYRDVRTYGVGESSMETLILDLVDNQQDPTLATYAKEGECFVRIASKRKTREEAEQIVGQMVDLVKERLDEYVYSTEGLDLPEVVGRLLVEKGYTISAAESCTGGMFVSTLVDVPGISTVLNRGLVTYSNQAKVDELGVSQETLDKYGAVSSQVAEEMAKGLFRVTGSDVCISVTGIAGPEGGTQDKPVGLVYIGLLFNGKFTCKELKMRNVSRNWNRNYAMLAMMNQVYKCLIS